MDGGNKVSINLEAGLDIKTSDMLVPLSQQTVQHNWQKFQGHCLPNSLRFEKNGWAAGWNVYNFKYNSFRKHINDIWLGAMEFNIDGTKLLSVYESEDSAASKKDIAFNPKTVIKSVSRDSASASGDNIVGTINGKNYTLSWDVNAHTATIDNTSLSLEQENRSDYSTRFTITDLSSSYDMAFIVSLPSDLTGDAIADQKYDGFDGTQYSWGGYTYDGTNVVTPEGNVVTPAVSDNLLTFEYEADITDETGLITYTMDKYYVSFTTRTLEQASGEDYYISSKCTTSIVPFNLYKNHYLSPEIRAENPDWSQFIVKMPIWVTLNLKSNENVTDAQKCDNVNSYAVQITTDGKFYGTVDINCENAYGDNVSSSITFTPNNPSPAVPLISRFNKIDLSNAIGPAENWSPNKFIINPNAMAYSYGDFSGFASDAFKKYWGASLTLESVRYDPTDYIKENKWYDWSDTSNVVYSTDIDILNRCSIVGKDEAYTQDEDHAGVSDKAYALSKCDDAIHDTSKLPVIAGTVYSEAQTATAYASAYDASGNYLVGTYETCATNLNAGPNFWPFNKVPKFNLTIDGTEVKGVYWTDGVQYITDLEAFKAMVRGSYTADAGAPVIDNTAYSRTRVVTRFKSVFDFPKYEDAIDKYNFKKHWEKYYPSYADKNPQDMEAESSSDTTYLDYNNIEEREITPSIWYVQPGQELNPGNDWVESVPFGNSEGVILYNGNTKSFTSHIYHQQEDANSVYNVIEPYHTTGYLWSWFGATRDLYDYYGTVRSIKLDQHSGNNKDVRKWSASLGPATAGIRVNQELRQIRHEEPYEHGTHVWYTYEYVPIDSGLFGRQVNPGCWIHDGHFGTDGSSYVLMNGVEQSYKMTKAGDITDGYSWSIGLYGYLGFKVRYPNIMTETDIAADGDKGYVHVMTFEKITAADITTDDQIWLTDANIGAKSRPWLLPELANISPNTDGKGSMTINLTSMNGFVVYSGKKCYDTSGNEIIADYYIPPIAMQDGNMEESDTATSLQLVWTPEVYEMPKDAQVDFTPVNSRGLQHRFYTQSDYKSVMLSVTIGSFNYENLTREMTFNVNDVPLFDFTYDIMNKKTEAEPDAVVLANSTETLTLKEIKGLSSTAELIFDLMLYYRNNKARFTVVSGATLVNDTNNILTISDGAHTIKYDYVGQAPVTKVQEYSVQSVGNKQNVTIADIVKQDIIAYMHAAYEGILNGTRLTFSYKGNDYIFDTSELTDDQENTVEVVATDIRRPTKEKAIGKIIASGKGAYEYQLVRQAWNTTVEVENFWWINSTHVLCLTQEYFILKRKTNELDDWNGDRFEDIYRLPRINFINSTSLYYTVTNVYGSEDGLFFVLSLSDNDTIKCVIMDPIHDMRTVDTVYFTISRHSIGQTLNTGTVAGKTAYLNTYNPLSASQLLTKAVFSNTLRDGRIIFGIHQSNNYDQWAAVYNIGSGTFEKSIQGYGYVGLHGDLTGGMIPKDYFDVNRGFSTLVEDISVLTKDFDTDKADDAFRISDLSKLNDITARVVGTPERQWYVSKRLSGIVSHLRYTSNGNFSIEQIPLTNKYCAVYKSPSFSAARIGDMMVEVFPFANLVKLPGAANGIWQTFMTFCGQPSIYMLNPRFAYLNYLQQSIGQYAYVHYNSMESLPEKEKGDFNNHAVDAVKGTGNISAGPEQKALLPLLNESHVFDKQIVYQKATCGLAFQDFGSIIFAAFAGALQMFDAKQSVNEEQKQTATQDLGRKYASNVMANADALLASSIMTQSSVDSGLISKVAAIKSLDMFYSTSDKQRVFAGPGFVEHQFTANCVAQSSTDTQVEGSVSQLSFTIRALTELQQRLTIAATEASIKALEKLAEAWQGATGPCSVNYGAAIAVGLLATASALRASLVLQQEGATQLAKVMDVICAQGITVSRTGGVTRHAMNPEGKHKYGEKHESFMWPCWGASNVQYTDETVNPAIKESEWRCELRPQKYFSASSWDSLIIDCETDIPSTSSTRASEDFVKKLRGGVPFYQAACYGSSEKKALPDKMAMIEGVETFLPKETFKNENIGMTDPMFTSSLIHDYIIDEAWDLSQCATYGLQQWVTVKDTKITNCPPSNMYVNGGFCGVATPYEAVEVKRGLSKAYMRPWAITPTTLAFNCTGLNTIVENELYHAFDGISYRIVELIGSSGLNKELGAFLYSFQVNNRFKRSNICPANELMGNFDSEPIQAVNTIDKLWTTITQVAKEKGMEIGTIGEDKDAVRWAIPIFTEQVSLLPAAVKTMAASTLAVSEGITCLVTAQVTDTNGAYKAPISVDFTIGKNVFRATEEYICSVTPAEAGNIITDLIPSLGLKFIGATPTEAFFYSKSTRCYYSFTGAALTKLEMMERFRDIKSGHWDFVNQEVVMPCLMTFKRLNAEVEDKDSETDNIIVPVLSKGQVSGELPPPITTIFNDRSWYKVVSLPSGLAYQGPNRVIINRSVFVEYMLDTLKQNLGKWQRMDKEKYVTKRIYKEQYKDVITDVKGVEGWTYNPFMFVTSPLGQSEDADCMFEWVITFCWPIEMDLIYGQNNFAVVNIAAETITPGGKVISRPTHVWLTKELFTRNGNYGYYSFRFQSKNGAGNRERLHIWSDQYIAISSIDCDCKVVTQRRTEQLTQQLDVQKLKEL